MTFESLTFVLSTRKRGLDPERVTRERVIYCLTGKSLLSVFGSSVDNVKDNDTLFGEVVNH